MLGHDVLDLDGGQALGCREDPGWRARVILVLVGRDPEVIGLMILGDRNAGLGLGYNGLIGHRSWFYLHIDWHDLSWLNRRDWCHDWRYRRERRQVLGLDFHRRLGQRGPRHDRMGLKRNLNTSDSHFGSDSDLLMMNHVMLLRGDGPLRSNGLLTFNDGFFPPSSRHIK
jgi:hypothetical protein